MKYKIIMKDKLSGEEKNNSIQELADIQACEEFIAANPATFQDFDTEIIDVTDILDQEKINKDSLKYLADTDYLIIREMDNGSPCPADIKLARQAARDSIVR